MHPITEPPTQTRTTAPDPVVGRFSLAIEQLDGFEFRVRFDKEHYDELVLDEPAPLGKDRGPNAARILAAAVGNCLSASLVFCLQRAGVAVQHLESKVEVELVRNSERKLRVGHLDVTLRPQVGPGSASLAECLNKFEDFCVVTQSVRQGLDVRVHLDLPEAEPSPGS